jgi:hypothetical protein
MPDQSSEEQGSALARTGAPASSPSTEGQQSVPMIEGLEKLPKDLVSMLFAQSTTRFGPDPETAKILVQAEQHEEDCRLAGYQATLENREKESARDHEYRLKKLNREFGISIVVLVGALALCGIGLFMMVIGQTAVGSNLLIGGGMLLLYILKGNSQFFGKE